VKRRKKIYPQIQGVTTVGGGAVGGGRAGGGAVGSGRAGGGAVGNGSRARGRYERYFVKGERRGR
jgi:hypothetical protein